MNRIIVFSKRNALEILRDPLSLIFNFVFPLIMLALFSCFVIGKSEDAIKQTVPMFVPNKIVPAIAIFGYSFLTLFGGMLVSKDRASAISIRLKASPLKPFEQFLGYFIPMILIAFIQTVIIYIFGALFGLLIHIKFDLFSLGTLFTFLINIPIAVFFISMGILIGLVVNDKTVGGISSLLVNLAAITSGMFMPIHTMGGFKHFAQALPFYHAVSLSQDVIAGFYPRSVNDYALMKNFYSSVGVDVSFNVLDTYWMHLLIICFYTLIIVCFTIIVFRKKNKD